MNQIKYIEIIKKCPYCNSDLIIINNDGIKILKCNNINCSRRLVNKIEHYCSKTHGLNIKGLGKQTISLLCDWGWLNGLKDIYELSKYKIEWESKPGFGKASVGKILNAIDTEGRYTKLESFISALGIPLVGSTVAKQIVIYYPTWEEFRKAVGGKWSDIDGFGYEMEKAINNFDYSEADEIVNAGFVTFAQEELQTEMSQTSAIKGKTFVITGKLSRKRDEIKREIESLGGRVTGSVSSKTDYLICNDKNSTTGKSADAKKLGVNIITEEEYINLKS